MRSREAWLAAIAATLGVSDACKRDATNAPAAVREVPSVSASASVAASAPSETASTDPIASAVPSTSASTASTASAKPPDLRNVGGIGTGHGACGFRVNPACGAVARPQEPTPTVNVQLFGGLGNDNAIAQSQLRSRMRTCAINGAKQDPNEQGDVQLQLDIDAHGTVTNVRSPGTRLGASTTQCMQRAARAITFAEGTARTLNVNVHVQRGY